MSSASVFMRTVCRRTDTKGKFIHVPHFYLMYAYWCHRNDMDELTYDEFAAWLKINILEHMISLAKLGGYIIVGISCDLGADVRGALYLPVFPFSCFFPDRDRVAMMPLIRRPRAAQESDD